MKKILIFVPILLFSCCSLEKIFKGYEKEEAAIYTAAAEDLAKGLCPRLEKFSEEEAAAAFHEVFSKEGEVDEKWLLELSRLVIKYSRGKVSIEAHCRADLEGPGTYFTLRFGDMAQGVKFTPEEPFFEFQYPIIAMQCR